MVVVVPFTPPGISSSSRLFTIQSVLTVCPIILVFAVCLFEPSAPTNSVPGLTQDGSLRHILSVSQLAEDILQHFELRCMQAGPPDAPNDALSSDAQLRFDSACGLHATRVKDAPFCIVAGCSWQLVRAASKTPPTQSLTRPQTWNHRNAVDPSTNAE